MAYIHLYKYLKSENKEVKRERGGCEEGRSYVNVVKCIGVKKKSFGGEYNMNIRNGCTAERLHTSIYIGSGR